MMRHPVALYLQATTSQADGHFELFERKERRPRRPLFGFAKRFARPSASERLQSEPLAADGSAR